MKRSTLWHNRWLRGLLLGTVVWVVSAALAPDLVSQAGNRAVEILRKAIIARGEVDYSAEATITTRRRDEPARTLRQLIYCKQGGKEQIKLFDEDGQLVMRKVSDGREEWEHFGTRGRLLRRTLPQAQQRRQRDLASLHILARNFAVMVEGTDTVAGRRAYRIGIARRGGHPVPVRKMWVDRENYLELKSEQYADDGRVVHVMSIDRINLAPTFQPGIFDLEPPANLKASSAPSPEFSGPLAEAERRVGFAALLPPQLPPGFDFLDDWVCIHKHKGHPVLLLRYTDGLDSFSVFQRKLEADWKPPSRQPGGHRGAVRIWTSRGFHFTLVGRLKPEHVETIRSGYPQ